MSLVDPSFELIDPCPDIFALFKQFNDTFFDGSLACCEVRWSPRMTTCAGICVYEGGGGLCSIRLSKPLLTLRPRKDLVETLLHEMIHAYLFVTRRFNIRDGQDGHGPMFQSHMHRINSIAGTRITIYHSFHAEVAVYKQHWWRCGGRCRDEKPFYGWVKRASNRAPGPNDLWWSRHQQHCGGVFEKVKEPEGYGQKKKKVQKSEVPVPRKPVKNLDSYFSPSKAGASGHTVAAFKGSGVPLGGEMSNSEKNGPSTTGKEKEQLNGRQKKTTVSNINRKTNNQEQQKKANPPPSSTIPSSSSSIPSSPSPSSSSSIPPQHKSLFGTVKTGSAVGVASRTVTVGKGRPPQQDNSSSGSVIGGNESGNVLTDTRGSRLGGGNTVDVVAARAQWLARFDGEGEEKKSDNGSINNTTNSKRKSPSSSSSSGKSPPKKRGSQKTVNTPDNPGTLDRWAVVMDTNKTPDKKEKVPIVVQSDSDDDDIVVLDVVPSQSQRSLHYPPVEAAIQWLDNFPERTLDEVGIDDISFLDGPSSASHNDNDQLVECPVCQIQLARSLINNHLDQCVQ